MLLSISLIDTTVAFHRVTDMRLMLYGRKIHPKQDYVYLKIKRFMVLKGRLNSDMRLFGSIQMIQSILSEFADIGRGQK